GKQIKSVVGFTAGGFYDRWARLLARFMPKYIPGNPDMIVQNMPGAGSVVATNYVYNVAKPDGLTIGYPSNGIGRGPRRSGNSYLRYPCLKNFFHNCLITNDLKATKARYPPQAAFNSVTCFRSFHPSIRRRWI